MSSLLWIGFAVLCVAVLAICVVILERAKNNHKSVADEAKADAAALEAQRDKAVADLIALKARLSPSLHSAADEINALVAKLQELLAAPPAPAPAPAPVGNLVVTPVAPLTPVVIPPAKPAGLGVLYIDRDDLMKSVGNSYASPVLLDDKPVHNGLGTGEPVAYYTWPNGGGIRITQPATAVAK